MDTSQSPERQSVTSRLHLITPLTIGGAIVFALIPGADAWFVYKRSAILHGEMWRMITGHWIHFSLSHLFYDCLVFGVAGSIIETKRLPHFGWLCLLAPWCISAVLLAVEPQIEWFGGLSALATAAMVYLALFGLEERGPWRWACVAILAGITGKVIYETITGHMLFATVKDEYIFVSPLSHVCGALFAMLFYGSRKLFLSCRLNQIVARYIGASDNFID